ncbi:Protein of unknown function [Bacillus cytotoxicus]|jgi:hypothetical protein
MLTA